MTTQSIIKELSTPRPMNIAEMRQIMQAIDQTIPDKQISRLKLEPIMVKLRVEHGWEQNKILLHYMFYKQFLYLCKTEETAITLPKDLDLFWHAHIEDNAKYEKDCKETFGRMLYHFPYFGMRSKTDALNLERASRQTRKLIQKSFGIHSWGNGATALCGPQSGCTGHDEQCSNKRFLRRPNLQTIAWN